jgi:hypothetical protein
MAEEKKEEAQVQPQLSVEDAKRLLIQQRDADMRACMDEINAVLDKYGLALQLAMIITSQGNVPQLTLVPASQPQGG